MPLWVNNLATVGIDAATSGGTGVIGSGTAHVKGSWVELENSTPFDACGIIVRITYHTAGALTDDSLVDIGIGAAAAETVLIPNILFGTISVRKGIEVCFPIEIPSGTRVAARVQHSSTSVTDIVGVSATLLGKDGFSGASACQTYGANTATSGGANVDPGAVLNTKGAYTELSSGISADANYLVIVLGEQENTARASAMWLLDIATGAGGAESVLVPDISFVTSSATSLLCPGSFATPIPPITAGTRLAARAACSITNATDRTIDVAVYAMNIPEPAAGTVIHLANSMPIVYPRYRSVGY